MLTQQFEIWIADLNPQIGTEPGKTRPVVVVHTNLLNQIPHPSTIVCPITTHVKGDAVVRYDQLADRWLIVMPIFRKSQDGTYSMCYAVSKTSNPFGPWYRYEFMRELFPDYPDSHRPC